MNETPTGIVEDEDFDGQPVLRGCDELLHQHREATVAAQGDHLAARIECLDTIGHPQRDTDRRIVERTGDLLATPRPQPIGTP